MRQHFNLNRDAALLGAEGYLLTALENQECVFDFRDKLERLVRKNVSGEATLENYHEFVSNNDENIRIHYKLSKLFWEGHWHLEVFERNKDFFQGLVGRDLDIQAKPHLRLARPEKPQDNIGFHRDTDYGASAYELSCVFSLTNLNNLSALRLVPNSHSLLEVKVTAVKNKDSEKDSIRHQLGVPYFLKTLADENLKKKLIPVPMKIGEVLVFSLAVIHGQEINKGSDTRWSIDARIKNSFIQSGSRSDYYRNFDTSPATQAGITHYKDNKQAK
jgi:sporadic carbohydrate cluster 2OG-Fe(II) oxygenase